MVEHDIQKIELENGRVPFDDWHRSLLDKKMRAAVDVRLARIRLGNFGNCRRVGDGMSELKIDLGPGLRVYYGEYAGKVVLLLGGGDKSTQQCDIKAAIKDPEYASAYLVQALESEDQATFLLALRDVVEAGGGASAVARQAHIQRESLYKALSVRGNPRLTTLRGILKSVGLRIAVTPETESA